MFNLYYSKYTLTFLSSTYSERLKYIQFARNLKIIKYLARLEEGVCFFQAIDY